MTSISSSNYAAFSRPLPSASQMAEQFFKVADKDGDSKISSAEFSGHMKNVPGASQGLGDLQKIFDEIDTDKDGSMSMEEATAYAQKLSDNLQMAMLQAQESAKKQEQQSGGFDPLDTNKDGMVSLLEQLSGTSASSPEDEIRSLLSQIKSTLASKAYQSTPSNTADALSGLMDKAV